jgi:uncharacterized protein with PIN domain
MTSADGEDVVPRFVVDTMLGRLARWLRAMGYDTLYPGENGDRRLLDLALGEGRILVTRDRMLARLAEPHHCLITAERLDAQIREALETLGLRPREADWLTRCLECNASLEPRPRDTLRGLVPEHIFTTHAEFVTCPRCRRIYWPGTHAGRILDRLSRLVTDAPGS